MGVHTMASQGNGQGSHFQLSPLIRQNSWYSLTLNEVRNQLGNIGKPLGSMNLDELFQSIWTAEANQSTVMDDENTSSASLLQREASLTLARAFSGKTVDEVWREIQQGQKKMYAEDMKCRNREATLSETTLEDFLVLAGLFAETSSSPALGLDSIDVVNPESYLPKVCLSSSSSIGTLSDNSTPGQKRDESDTLKKTMDRRLRRKIKNRESAARSRARKQAYHNELVSKVSRLEEENIKHKKEKEFEEMRPCAPCPEPKYQLRRTSSSSF